MKVKKAVSGGGPVCLWMPTQMVSGNGTRSRSDRKRLPVMTTSATVSVATWPSARILACAANTPKPQNALIPHSD